MGVVPLELQQRLREYLRENGLKTTKQRQVILDVFIELNRHVSLDELLITVQSKMPQVGMATIYRTMRLFVGASIAHERKFDGGLTRYELAIEGEHHDHLICILCGHIFEFEDDVIESRQEVIAHSHGLIITSHKLEIYGRCKQPTTCEYHPGT